MKIIWGAQHVTPHENEQHYIIYRWRSGSHGSPQDEQKRPRARAGCKRKATRALCRRGYQKLAARYS